MGERSILRKGSEIRVVDRLTWELNEEFVSACEDLVRSGCSSPVIDLAEAGQVTTPYAGIIASVAERCSFYGRPLTVRILPTQRRVFDAIGLGKLARLVALTGEEELCAESGR